MNDTMPPVNRITSRHPTVIDAKEALFGKITAENRELREKLGHLITIGQENEALQARFDRLEENIFAAENLADLVRTLATELAEYFAIPLMTLFLLPPFYQQATETLGRNRNRNTDDGTPVTDLPLAAISPGVYQVLFASGRTVSGAGMIPEIREYTPFNRGPAVTVGSSAAIPLTAGRRTIGALVLASPDGDKFRADHATDFIERLTRRLALAVENLIARDELQHLSHTDQLTGVLNRRSLNRILGTEFERARRYAQPLTILMIDLDDFKQVNDRYGHAAGDRLLEHFAAILRTCTRGSDTVFRYGGDEFVVIMPHTNNEQARAAADKIDLQVHNQGVPWQNETLPIKHSRGLASWPETAAETAEQLLQTADQRLYEVKRQRKEGRG
ncbi:MAG: sensor domain-containing diguanylate cyclase [Deltaproteobacteria bacterium]|nr:sensor domain-containing diguanylate cyclase [Candidatus Anaeroferrophillacea bacterium]